MSELITKEEIEKAVRKQERQNKVWEEIENKRKKIQELNNSIDELKQKTTKARNHALCQYGGLLFSAFGWKGKNAHDYRNGNFANLAACIECNREILLEAVQGTVDWKAELAKKEAAVRAESSAYVASVEQNEEESPQTQQAHSSETT